MAREVNGKMEGRSYSRKKTEKNERKEIKVRLTSQQQKVKAHERQDERDTQGNIAVKKKINDRCEEANLIMGLLTSKSSALITNRGVTLM